MPRGSWSDKDERMYRHVKDQQIEGGTDENRAQEIAARTVNKHRREEGRVESSASRGTGNPNAALEKRTVSELRNRARELKIPGRTVMRKDELIEAIRERG